MCSVGVNCDFKYTAVGCVDGLDGTASQPPRAGGGWSDFFDVKSIITMLLSVDERKYEMFT